MMVTQGEVFDALVRLRDWAQEAMYSSKPNSSTCDRARYDRDWAIQLLDKEKF